MYIHTNKIHTDIKHTTEQIKKINAMSQFVVRNEIMSLISVRSNPSIGSVKKMLFIYHFLRGSFIMKVVEIALKTQEIAPFLKNFLGKGGHAPKPPSNGSQLRGMYCISKSPPKN